MVYMYAPLARLDICLAETPLSWLDFTLAFHQEIESQKLKVYLRQGFNRDTNMLRNQRRLRHGWDPTLR